MDQAQKTTLGSGSNYAPPSRGHKCQLGQKCSLELSKRIINIMFKIYNLRVKTIDVKLSSVSDGT